MSILKMPKIDEKVAVSGWVPLTILIIWAVLFFVWGLRGGQKKEKESMDDVLTNVFIKNRINKMNESTSPDEMTGMFSMLGLFNILDGGISPVKLTCLILFLGFSMIVIKQWVESLGSEQEAEVDSA